ncbi:MAG: hypothetical protein ACJLTB_09555 [Algoriphagus aquaeductus]|uniref:hypothetical protein n=1 Tax=Algoriphagus aquaeductus TaxID=475299 RepID=UPI003879AA6E
MRAQFQSFFFFNWTKFLWGSWAFLIFQGAIAQKSSTSSVQGLYFPPVGSSEWEKTPLQELGWNQAALAELLAWLPTQDTRGFIVLKGGRIVLEEYWGSKLTGLGDMDQPVALVLGCGKFYSYCCTYRNCPAGGFFEP